MAAYQPTLTNPTSQSRRDLPGSAITMQPGTRRARHVPVSRVTHGDSRSITEQPALRLTCATAGPSVAATSFASRGSRLSDTGSSRARLPSHVSVGVSVSERGHLR
jgi:hypothetical protein